MPEKTDRKECWIAYDQVSCGSPRVYWTEKQAVANGYKVKKFKREDTVCDKDKVKEFIALVEIRASMYPVDEHKRIRELLKEMFPEGLK